MAIRGIGQGIGRQLNPMQENVLKIVQKVHGKQVEEAMEQGASGEQVLADAGISIATGQAKTDEGDLLSTTLAGQQPPELERPIPKRAELFGGFFKEHPATFQTRLQNEAIIRKMLGMEPLQKGERERMGLEGLIDLRKELLTAGDVKALSPESAGKFNLLVDGLDATSNISNLLSNRITAQLFAQGVPNFLKSQNAKILQSNIERSVQAKTRIETGAALQPTELKSTALRFMPQKGDTLKTALMRLKPLNDYFAGSIRVADPTGVHLQRARGQTISGVIEATNIKSITEVK